MPIRADLISEMAKLDVFVLYFQIICSDDIFIFVSSFYGVNSAACDVDENILVSLFLEWNMTFIEPIEALLFLCKFQIY